MPAPTACLASFHNDPNGFPTAAHPAPPEGLPDGGGPKS